jgi:hypothetical protein
MNYLTNRLSGVSSLGWPIVAPVAVAAALVILVVAIYRVAEGEAILPWLPSLALALATVPGVWWVSATRSRKRWRAALDAYVEQELHRPRHARPVRSPVERV